MPPLAEIGQLVSLVGFPIALLLLIGYGGFWFLKTHVVRWVERLIERHSEFLGKLEERLDNGSKADLQIAESLREIKDSTDSIQEGVDGLHDKLSR